MSESPPHFAEPEDAYFEFFRADSAKEPMGWANVMSYPHVRVSARGNTGLYPTRQDYADAADWTSREATGWVRSKGIEPVRLHESARKVHLMGGWTRFNNNDEPILSNRVTYILTKPGDSWGIQARFGTDSWSGTDDPEAASAAVDLVAGFCSAVREQPDSAAGVCRYPLTVVDIGTVKQLQAEDQFVNAHTGTEQVRWTARDIRAVQAGSQGVLVSAELVQSGEPTRHGLFLVGQNADSGWQMAGVSLTA